MTPRPAPPATSRPATTSCRWDGTATALSSVVHGDEVLGTMTTFRRERIARGDRIDEIPVVSGNALRGRLRRIGATMLWEALGCPPLPMPVAAALWSGGALGKRRPAGQPALLSGAELARVRTLVPHLAVFGGAGGGRILKGTLAVGKLVPICAETAHLLPTDQAAESLPSVHDLLQLEAYTRVDDTLQPLAAVDHPDPLTASTEADPAVVGGVGESGLQLRYEIETLMAGTRFTMWLALTDVTAPQRAFFLEVLDRWRTHAQVGGRSRVGHGRLAVQLTDQTLTSRPGVAVNPDWRAAVTDNWSDVIAALHLLQ
jgi:hypothetical protein